jgi:hypothetical protein
MVVSEPLGRHVETTWVALPQASALRLRKGEVEVSRFQPAAPALAR